MEENELYSVYMDEVRIKYRGWLILGRSLDIPLEWVEEAARHKYERVYANSHEEWKEHDEAYQWYKERLCADLVHKIDLILSYYRPPIVTFDLFNLPISVPYCVICGKAKHPYNNFLCDECYNA